MNIKRISATTGILFAALVLGGCGLTAKQIGRTQSFASATESIGKLGENEFVNIRNSVIEMNKELVAIDATKKAGSLEFDKTTKLEATATRVAAAKALKSYGEVLLKLVTEDPSADLQAAANSLVENTSIAIDMELSEDGKSAIGGIIAGLGSFWVEKEKADAARKIIPAYKDAVDKLAELLAKDFSLKSPGFLLAYHDTADRLKNAAIRVVNKGGQYSVQERDRAVRALVMADSAILRAETLDNNTQAAIQGLKKANAELVKVIGEEDVTTDDIKNYAKQIQELVNMYQVLSG